VFALGPVGAALDAGSDTRATTAAVVAGLFGAVAAFAALTLGELAAARRARRLGLTPGVVRVSGWGPTSVGAEPPQTWEQARALGRVKPAGIAGGALGVLAAAGLAAGAGWTPLAAALLAAALLSAALAVFDLVPGPGRSGGLLVQARGWRRQGRAAGDALLAQAGVRSGWALILAGFAVMLFLGFVGFWLVVVGWLTLMTGRVEQVRARMTSATANVTAAEAMSPGVPEAPGWRTVGSVLDEIALPSRRQVFPLRRFDGTVTEVVLLADLAAVPADDRDLKRAQDLARPAVVLRPHESVDRLVPAAAALPSGFGVVVGDPDGPAAPGAPTEVLGVIGPEDITRAMALAAARNGSDGSGSASGWMPPNGGGTWRGPRVR
jgi:hypothetical protein